MPRLNMRRDPDFDFFISSARYGGKEIHVLNERMGKARGMKAGMGLYAGGNVGLGFYIDPDTKSDTYEQYLEYKPHADVIRELFNIALRQGNLPSIYRDVRKRGIYFPAFEPYLAITMNTRSTIRFCSERIDREGNVIGYEISISMLKSIFMNPSYAGILIRSGKLIGNGKLPILINPDLFVIVNQKLFGKNTKPRGKTTPSTLLAFQGLLYFICIDDIIRPVYSASRNRKDSENIKILKCPCTINYPERGGCFHVESSIILQPIEDHVLACLSFSDMADEIISSVQEKYVKGQSRKDRINREKQELTSQIETLKHNFALVKMDSESASSLQTMLDLYLRQLKVLEEDTLINLAKEDTVTKEDINLITAFLADMRSKWVNVPAELQNHLYKLLLDKIIISHTDRHDFLVEIQWKTGNYETLWIERPLDHSVCKPWSEKENSLLINYFPTATVSELVALFPDKNIDAIKEMARRRCIGRKINLHHPWNENDDKILSDYSDGNLSYKQMRFLLRHHLSLDIRDRMKRLGLKNPEQKQPNWHVINTLQNETSSLQYSNTSAAHPPG